MAKQLHVPCSISINEVDISSDVLEWASDQPRIVYRNAEFFDGDAELGPQGLAFWVRGFFGKVAAPLLTGLWDSGDVDCTVGLRYGDVGLTEQCALARFRIKRPPGEFDTWEAMFVMASSRFADTVVAWKELADSRLQA
jgi:hypothetical protein